MIKPITATEVVNSFKDPAHIKKMEKIMKPWQDIADTMIVEHFNHILRIVEYQEIKCAQENAR